MRAAPRPEPVREPEEVLLVDGVQHLDQRPLKDLVLQRGDSERPQPPVRFRDEHPPSRLCPVCPPVDPGVQIAKVRFEIWPVIPPRHPVDPRSSARADRPIRLPQTVDGHVMKKRSEPHILRAPPGAHDPDHLTRLIGHCVRDVFGCRVPLGRSPSLHHLRPRFPRLVRRLRRYYRTVRLPAVVHRGLTAKAFPYGPTQRRSTTPRTIQDGASSTPAGDRGTSRFSRMEICVRAQVL
jgi:hypothetical protein